MNVMAQAHKAAKEFFASVTETGLSYAKVLQIKLRVYHREYKAMSQAEQLKAQTIAQFEKRIEELKEANEKFGHKWIVVCGDAHPMPINFESDTSNFWSNVEGCSKWASELFAKSAARRVVNGNQEVGKAVLMTNHIEWDIANLEKLIKDLKGE